MNYYLLPFLLDRAAGVLIWYNNDRDGILVDTHQSLLAFRTPTAADAYAQQHTLLIQPSETTPHDFDAVTYWIAQDPCSPRIACQPFLAMWNLLTDAATSIGVSFEQQDALTKQIYDKLFWGTNLPAVTPSGQSYTPLWTEAELLRLRDTFQRGMTMFRQRLVWYDAP